MSVITEIHGWVTLRYTCENSDEALVKEEEHQQDIKRKVEEKAESCGFSASEVCFFQSYGEIFMTVCGFKWHYDECSEVISLYEYIAEIAKGSYGLLYVNSEREENQFRVLVLRKGSLEWRDDPFLSPLIPMIEDEATD